MKRISSIIFLLFLVLPAAAQRPFSRDYWLNESNTPVKVNALARDRQGYLWLGTDAGLYRFNGHHFSLIPDTTSGQISALSCAGDTVYCGYDDGRLALYADGGMHPLPLRGPGPASHINSLSWHAGCLWVCTDAEGAFAFVNGYSYHLDTRNGLSDNYAYGIAFSGSCHALIATDRGVNSISLGSDGKCI